MVVVIHQPHYMPWLGYLHRMAQADLFVLLDHVQFERANYQNRTRIRMQSGSGQEARWLTVPVVQRSQKERIIDKQIDNRLEGLRHWAAVHWSTLRHAYREAEFFDLYAPALKRILEARWERLAALNEALLDLLREAFGIGTPLVRSSELGVEGAKSELVLATCRAVGASRLMLGFGGSRDYLDRAAFARAGIDVTHHEFTHPQYRQCGESPFIPGLTAFDLLFNCGPQSRAILLGKTAPHAACAIA